MPKRSKYSVSQPDEALPPSAVRATARAPKAPRMSTWGVAHSLLVRALACAMGTATDDERRLVARDLTYAIERGKSINAAASERMANIAAKHAATGRPSRYAYRGTLREAGRGDDAPVLDRFDTPHLDKAAHAIGRKPNTLRVRLAQNNGAWQSGTSVSLPASDGKKLADRRSLPRTGVPATWFIERYEVGTEHASSTEPEQNV